MNNNNHIVLVTDAWFPQINGVVRTLHEVVTRLRGFGHTVTLITPDQYRTIACPTYPEIRLAINAFGDVNHRLLTLRPNHIHIATEGPLGLLARHACLRHKLAFTTSFHTKFPEYIEKRLGVPANWSYRFLRWFHTPAAHMMVATPALQKELEAKGFTNTRAWTRGVDTELFHPKHREQLPYPSPVYVYVGRVAVEKNIEAFLSLPLDGTRLVVGDGPQRKALEARYRDAVFVGAKHGEELARYYASSDVFVFPSKTDTFGLVMLEALASGTPVAAYPVTGPIDVITDAKAGCLHDDLQRAIKEALTLNRDNCRSYALKYSWEHCAKLLEQALTPAQALSQ